MIDCKDMEFTNMKGWFNIESEFGHQFSSMVFKMFLVNLINEGQQLQQVSLGDQRHFFFYYLWHPILIPTGTEMASVLLCPSAITQPCWCQTSFPFLALHIESDISLTFCAVSVFGSMILNRHWVELPLKIKNNEVSPVGLSLNYKYHVN